MEVGNETGEETYLSNINQNISNKSKEDNNSDCKNCNSNINNTNDIGKCSDNKLLSESEVLNLANGNNKEIISQRHEETSSENGLSNVRSRKQNRTQKNIAKRSSRSKASSNQTEREDMNMTDPEILCSENKNNSLTDTGYNLRHNKRDSGSNTRKDHSTKRCAVNQDDSEDLTMPFATLADLKMPNYDIKIDPNSKASFIHSPPPQRSPSPPESPETKRKRLEEHARYFERHGRLHPSNKHLNQGPVENPPLISPATMVGYSPGGQRYEFDLNTDRPTRFNSEYDRRMYDNAMRINVSKMMLELSDGSYLPPSLDPNIERKYYEEMRVIKEEANKFFEQCAVESDDNDEWEDMTDSDDERHMVLLQSEEKLLELVGHAELKLVDFPEEMSTMLNGALQLDITPVMFKKNPIVLEVLYKLTKSTNSSIRDPAKTLLSKAKALFDVPSGLTFKEHFLSQVEIFKEKTDYMSFFQLMMTTDEPADEEDCVVNTEDGVREDFQPSRTEISDTIPTNTEDDEPVWIAVEDLCSYVYPRNSDSGMDTTEVYIDEARPSRRRSFNWEWVEVSPDEFEVPDDDEIDLMIAQLLETDDDDDSDSEEELFSLLERIHGMLHNGVHGFIILHSFQLSRGIMNGDNSKTISTY